MKKDKPKKGYDRLDRLLTRHHGLTRLLCWRGAHGNEAQCEDLVQDCYLALWQRIGALRSNVSRLEEAAWVVWNCRDILDHVKALVGQSVEKYLERNFTSLQVSFGCTGGQHRSVYCAEQLAAWLTATYPCSVALRHREQDR